MNDEVQTGHRGLIARYLAENGNWVDAAATDKQRVIIYFAKK